MSEENTSKRKTWVRTIMQWVRLENAPQYGKRRMRQLQTALEHKSAELELSKINRQRIMEDYERLEQTVRVLLLNDVERENELKELRERLQTAISSAWSNEQMISFKTFDFNDPQIDHSTQAIDVSELRADLADPREAVITKITQPNPDTGRHDTVEIRRPEVVQPKKEQVKIPLLPPGLDGSLSPTHVPGMKKVLVS